MQPRWPARRRARALAASLVLAGAVTGTVPAAASAGTCQNWTGTQRPGPDMNLIEHWNGATWKVVPSPDPGTGGDFGSLVCWFRLASQC